MIILAKMMISNVLDGMCIHVLHVFLYFHGTYTDCRIRLEIGYRMHVLISEL